MQGVDPSPAKNFSPPDAVQRLDQTGDAAGFNGIANVGLHTAELKPGYSGIPGRWETP